ncbi:hypothetical protein ACFOWX_06460 [Sphingorhabdus arenilitoris]|uniref:DUF3592 domain-containing protein n=1 Tax=Sphingorhabdus arenilitoris TaxID=1490041 RepID=A0ABV8RF94_9SPHN
MAYLDQDVRGYEWEETAVPPKNMLLWNFIGFLFLFLFAAPFIVGISFSDTYMLKGDNEFFDDDVLFVAVGIGVAAGIISAALVSGLINRIAVGFVVTLLCFGFISLWSIGVVGTYREYQAFRPLGSIFAMEEFRISDLDRSGRGGHYAIVSSKDFYKTPRIQINAGVYEFLLPRKAKVGASGNRHYYDTGYCVNLQVERNDSAARIHFKGEIKAEHVKPCPISIASASPLRTAKP